MLYLISGPSGAGKTTIVNKLVEENPRLQRIITYTTRPPRKGEIHGVDYFFVSEEEFWRMIEKRQLFEFNKMNYVYYGASLGSVIRSSPEKSVTIWILDFSSALEVSKRLEGTKTKSTTIFISSPSLLETIKRISLRGAMDEGMMTWRVDEAIRASAASEKFQHVVMNEHLEECCLEIKNIMGL